MYYIEEEKIENLTDGIGLNRLPRWINDGQRIVFVSTKRDGLGKRIGDELDHFSEAIFIMDLDGSNLQRIGNNQDEWILWYSIIP